MIKLILFFIGLSGLCLGDVVITPRYHPDRGSGSLPDHPVDLEYPNNTDHPIDIENSINTDDHPIHITPKQTTSCKNINYAFTTQSATLYSINYPENYPSNLDCSHFLSTPAGTTITVQCNDFNVPCDTDQMYMSLSGSSTFSDAIGICGSGNFSQTSKGNQLNVGLISGVSSSTKRYACTFTKSDSTTAPTSTAASSGAAAPTSTAASSGAAAPSTSGTCKCGNKFPTTRIVGGSAALAGEFPWRVLVFVYNSTSGSGGICGGTIISPNWILTAAHCTMDFQPGYKINIYYNATGNGVSVRNSGATVIVADRYVQHASFNRNTLNNDITLVHLPTPITYGKNVQPACLPFSLVGETFQGKTVSAAGWGTPNAVGVNKENTDKPSTYLQKVDLPMLTTTECQKYYKTQVTSNMLCTYLPGKDTCQGDSGGSIDYQNPANGKTYAIGVTSFGAGCAQTGYPGVYTKVTNYLDWIKTTTAENFCQA